MDKTEPNRIDPSDDTSQESNTPEKLSRPSLASSPSSQRLLLQWVTAFSGWVWWIATLGRWIWERVYSRSDSNPVSQISSNHTPATEKQFGLGVLSHGEKPIVDLVAVHGLDGHREESWTADNGVLWLRDELPKKLPNLRILTYGYDVRTQDSTLLSLQTLYDHAEDLVASLNLRRQTEKIDERPIIFLAHGLGGIVVKSALIHSDSTSKAHNKRYKAIKRSTYGILFFGTPHQGTDGFKQISVDAESHSMHTSDIVLRVLERDSELLQQQLGQYTHISKDFDTKFFYETYQTDRQSSGHITVVPKSSAVVPSATDTETFAINSDHFNMVKYKSADDNSFQKVSAIIELMVEKAPNKISEVWLRWKRKQDAVKSHNGVTFEIPFQLEYHQNPKFTGRENLLSALNVEIGDKKSRIVILYGTGGMGKTQVALEYVYTHQKDYTSIFWINAASSETVAFGFRAAARRLINHHAKIATAQPDYLQIAQVLGMHGVVDGSGRISNDEETAQCIIEGMKQWFSHKDNSAWLLVFDNFDDLGAFDINFFIPNLGGTIIITSRRRESVGLGVGFEVEKMLEKEGIGLLIRSANLEVDQLNSDGKAAEDITQRLGCLPLALDQAGAYIASRRIPLQKYTEIYEKNFKRILSERPRDPAWSYGDRTVFTTWEISFQAIRSENQDAAELLLLCSFLSNEDIHEKMLIRGQQLEEDDISLSESLALLFSYSLAQRKRVIGESFYIHPLIHQWARERLDLQERVKKAKEAFILVSQAVDYCGTRTPDLWNFEAQIIPHIYTVCRNEQKYLRREMEDSGDLDWVDSMERIANALYYQESSKGAEGLQARVLEMRERVLSKEHPDTLTAMNNLASTYSKQGRSKEAEELQALVLETRERVLPKGHQDTLTAMDNLAVTYNSHGRYKEAEELEMLALEGRERSLGKEHPDTLSTMGNLAFTYSRQGRYKEAEVLEVRVLEAKGRVLGKEHPDSLVAMSNLASTYSNQGRFKEAEELQVQVLEARERVLVKEHPDTLTALDNLALTYSNQGRLGEAEELQARVLEARERVLIKGHPDTIVAMNNLALNYRNQGRFKEAEELQMRVLEANERVLGKEHLETLTAMNNLASTYSNQGRFKEAEKFEVRALEARERVLGKEHPDTLTAMNNLASTYSNQGRAKEAEELQVQVLEARERLLGKEHPDTLTAMNNLASTYSNQGRFKEAEKFEVRALEARERVLGEEHPDTLKAMNHLASTFNNQERPKEAEELLVRVLEASERSLGKEHPDTLGAMDSLASTYSNQGRLNEAEVLEVRVLEARERVLGKEHPDTLTAMNNLALTYGSQGQSKEAGELQVQVLRACEKVLGKEHQNTLRAMNNLASTYGSQERFEEAEELQVRVLEARERLLGKEHPDTLKAMNNLASTFNSQGRSKEAEELQVRVLETREESLGKEHPDTLRAMGDLASTYSRQGRSKEAGELKLQVLYRILGLSSEDLPAFEPSADTSP